LYTYDHHIEYAGELIKYFQNKQHKVIFITLEKDELVHHLVKSYPELKLRTLHRKGTSYYKMNEIPTPHYIFTKTVNDFSTLSRAFKIAEEWGAKILHLLWVDTTFLLPLYILTHKTWGFKFFCTFFPLTSFIGSKVDHPNYRDYLKKGYQYFNLILLKIMIRKKSIDGIFIHNVYPQKFKEQVINRVKWISHYQNRIKFLYDTLCDDYSIYCREAKARQKLGLPKNIPILLSFGRIRRIKGLDILFEAMKLIDEKICLVIAGEPDYLSKNDIERYKRKFRKSHTIIDHLHFIPANDVPYYFVAADAIVMPYRRHYALGTSGIFMQAISARKPVICSDIGTIGQIVKENSFGITVTPESIQSLAEGILNFLARKEEIKRAVQNPAKQYMIRADWNRVANIIEETYKKLTPV
ncbi:MAG: glycosyltransferase family 4 protein, partial [Candidatus Bathyarchaeota archaeon]|nr:glycosyltransferase family 4 protein [Candidatus Bathyarchaeota archaeon]